MHERGEIEETAEAILFNPLAALAVFLLTGWHLLRTLLQVSLQQKCLGTERINLTEALRLCACDQREAGNYLVAEWLCRVVLITSRRAASSVPHERTLLLELLGDVQYLQGLACQASATYRLILSQSLPADVPVAPIILRVRSKADFIKDLIR